MHDEHVGGVCTHEAGSKLSYYTLIVERRQPMLGREV